MNAQQVVFERGTSPAQPARQPADLFDALFQAASRVPHDFTFTQFGKSVRFTVIEIPAADEPQPRERQ